MAARVFKIRTRQLNKSQTWLLLRQVWVDVVTGDLSADGKSNLSVRTSTFENFGRRDLRFHLEKLMHKKSLGQLSFPSDVFQEGPVFLPGFLGSAYLE